MMSKKRKYTVLHAQNIEGAWRAVGDDVELTDAQAKYLIGNAIALAKPKSKAETSSNSGRKHRDRTTKATRSNSEARRRDSAAKKSTAK